MVVVIEDALHVVVVVKSTEAYRMSLMLFLLPKIFTSCDS